MPFDDSNIRKLVRYQLEKKIHFSRYKPLSIECKQLILSLLEPDIQLRATIYQIKSSDWFRGRIPTNIYYSNSIEDSTIRMMKSDVNRKNSFDPLPKLDQ